MKPPALGIGPVNSMRLLPVQRISTAAITNAQGAMAPIQATITGIVRKTLSAGAMLARVLEVVWKKPASCRQVAVSGGPSVAAARVRSRWRTCDDLAARGVMKPGLLVAVDDAPGRDG